MRSMTYELVVQADLAELRISGRLSPGGIAAMLEHCRALPPRVRTLRVDLQQLGTMSADTTDLVRRVLEAWRAQRDGQFELRTQYLVATCRRLDDRGWPSRGWMAQGAA